MIHSAPHAKKRCNTSQGFGAFSVSHVIAIDSYLGVSLSFFLSLDFIAISDCVFNNKNNYVLGHTGYQVIITIVEGGAIFSKNSTFVLFDGAAWTPRLRSPSPIMAPGHGY